MNKNLPSQKVIILVLRQFSCSIMTATLSDKPLILQIMWPREKSPYPLITVC